MSRIESLAVTPAASTKRAYIFRRCLVAMRTARLFGAAMLYALFGVTLAIWSGCPRSGAWLLIWVVDQPKNSSGTAIFLRGVDVPFEKIEYERGKYDFHADDRERERRYDQPHHISRFHFRHSRRYPK